jgi:hypothetical protein
VGHIRTEQDSADLPDNAEVESSILSSPTTKVQVSGVFCNLVSNSSAGSDGPALTKLTTLVSTGKRIAAPFKVRRRFLPYL